MFRTISYICIFNRGVTSRCSVFSTLKIKSQSVYYTEQIANDYDDYNDDDQTTNYQVSTS